MLVFLHLNKNILTTFKYFNEFEWTIDDRRKWENGKYTLQQTTYMYIVHIISQTPMIIKFSDKIWFCRLWSVSCHHSQYILCPEMLIQHFSYSHLQSLSSSQVRPIRWILDVRITRTRAGHLNDTTRRNGRGEKLWLELVDLETNARLIRSPARANIKLIGQRPISNFKIERSNNYNMNKDCQSKFDI